MARRLAAIMFTDVVGFTASAQADEAAALGRLREQEGIVRPLLAPYGGREIKSTGDGFLVEFESALKATECAVEIQRRLRERNSKEPNAPIRLRIGIHIGDVEEQGGDIFGDAVNVASRVVPLAEPGGVCVSEHVFAQVHHKVPYRVENLGPKVLKGLRESVGIYRVVMPWNYPGVSAETPGPTRLAVLPFANISPDPNDAYFADGLTEELITILSQLHELRVIARTSVNQYKSTSKPISQIGSELGVSSVLEGSVRKSGDQLRIAVQLIAADTQEHVWTSTYDRTLDDVFAIQSDVAKRIAKVLKVKVRAAEEVRLEEKPTASPESYLAYLRGRALLAARSEERLRASKREFELAASLDGRNAAAYSGLADVTHLLGEMYHDASWSEWDRGSKALAVRAIELDPDLADAHNSLAALLWHEFDYTAAEREFKLALSLNPSCAPAHHWYANLLEDEARTEESLRELILGEESDPHSLAIVHAHALILIWHRKLDDARIVIERVRELDTSGALYHAVLARYYGTQSDFSRAFQEIDRANELEPGAWDDMYAWHYALSGETAKARKILRKMESMTERKPIPSDIAWGYAALGDLDKCFAWLEKAFENHELFPRWWRAEPALEPVRGDPRFRHLLQRMNLA